MGQDAVPLQLSVVDIGGFRYFDARGVTCEAFAGFAPIDAACRACGTSPPASVYVWVLPRGFERFLTTLGSAAVTVLLGRLTDPAMGCAPGSLLPDLSRPGPPPAVTLAYVEGWVADTMSASIARQCGVELLQELPTLLDPSCTETVRELFDRAASGRASSTSAEGSGGRTPGR